MGRVWITTGSTTFDATVNPIAAACHQGYVPETVLLLENPGVEEVVDSAAFADEVDSRPGTIPTDRLTSSPA